MVCLESITCIGLKFTLILYVWCQLSNHTGNSFTNTYWSDPNCVDTNHRVGFFLKKIITSFSCAAHVNLTSSLIINAWVIINHLTSICHLLFPASVACSRRTEKYSLQTTLSFISKYGHISREGSPGIDRATTFGGRKSFGYLVCATFELKIRG